MLRRIILFIGCFLITIIHYGQQNHPDPGIQGIVVQKFTLPIKFDGTPDEEAWDAVTPFPMIMFEPVFGKSPTEPTENLIGYNDEYLYIASRLYYSDIHMMRSVTLKRDFMGAGSDNFGVIIDTFNDKQNGLIFFTTPDAVRWDASIHHDAVVQPDQIPFNIHWNTFWDVKTQQGSNGWSLEMRIPWSSLRFQEKDGEIRMGIIMFRWMPAKNESSVFPAIPPDWGRMSTLKPSQAQEIVFHDLYPDRPVYVVPYVITGYESNYKINNEETDYVKKDKPELECGLDIKYGLSNNMILDLTLNTDFAQVEVDDQQINLTRFSLYFPEKRLFFLEQSSMFDFLMDWNSNLFYSRRIGISDDGDPVRILAGTRITGRKGIWDLGFLTIQTTKLWKSGTDGTREMILPSENFGVLRLRRQVFNENSYLGTIFTSRLGMNGSYNIVYGFDGVIRVVGNDYLDMKWSQSFETGLQNKSLSEPSKIYLLWERRSHKGVGYSFGYVQSGSHFNPGIGFEMMNDFAMVNGSLRYDWISGEKSRLYRHTLENKFAYMTYIEDGSLMTITNQTGWFFQTKSQWQGSIYLVYNLEHLKDSLDVAVKNLFLLPGRYQFLHVSGTFTTPVSQSFVISLITDAGNYFDGTRLSFQLIPGWNISRHLGIGGSYSFDWVKFNARGQEMINHLFGLKALYMPDTRFSFHTYLQYNTAIQKVITNIRFRFNPKEGNDLYIVFNEGRNTNLQREIPNLPVYDARTLLLKYTYTFNL